MGRTETALRKIFSHIAQIAVVLVGITFITFSIMYISPKNPAEIWLAGIDGNVGMISEEAIREQEKIMGLDKPFIVQYGNWINSAIHGDLGTSYTTRRAVTTELIERMAPTAKMTFISLAITAAVSIPLGILCAVYKDRLLDNVLRIFSFFGISMPSFVLSILFLWFFCIKLKWFTVIAADGMRGLVLPIAVLVIQCASKMVRQVRAIVLEQLEQPYVEGAIARGVGYKRILFSHVLKNSAAPILTCISIYVGVFLGGSAIIEGIFSVNGIGSLAVSAVSRMDYNLIQGFVLWCALVYLIVNLAVDILSAIIDPRIKYERR
ncbi:MAG: ABC transporter permease [Clostridiales bacterium]|nr:ABC transporter permease [Clostridiales bacterium]